MHILITGGNGFLGRSLAQALLARGHVVNTLDLTEEVQPGVGRHYHGSYDSRALLNQALQGVEAVCHMMGYSLPSTPLSQLNEELEQYIRGLRVLLETMAAHQVARIVYPSSGGTVYGEGPRRPFREDDPLRPASVYALGRVLSEQLIGFFSRVTPLSALILRFSNPYGNLLGANPRQGVIDNFAHRLINDKPLELWGDEASVRDYIHIEDAVEAAARLLEMDKLQYDIYNIGNGQGTSLKQLIDIFQGLDDNIEVVQKPPAAKLLDYSVLDTTRLCAELADFQPRPIEAGIREFVTDLHNCP